MDDYLVCSDFCEENGFPRQAEMLRALSGASGKLYVVAERGMESDDDGFDRLVDGDGSPRRVYINREEAERTAAVLTGHRLSKEPLRSRGDRPDHFTSLALEELDRGVSLALGIDFRLFPENQRDPTPFPESMTDEQFAEIARHFDRLEIFHVIEVEISVATEAPVDGPES